MKRMTSVHKLCTAAICVALCCVLPPVFHAVGGGSAFSPMHFPVLLCGILCGPLYGVCCGISGPLISCLLSGMPSAPQLISMIPELCAYGLIAGLIFKHIRTGRSLADLYLSLLPAMVLGRIAGGIVKALVYLNNAESYSVAAWASSYLAGTLPGAALQLILIPALVLALDKTRVIPSRYAQVKTR